MFYINFIVLSQLQNNPYSEKATTKVSMITNDGTQANSNLDDGQQQYPKARDNFGSDQQNTLSQWQFWQ